MQNFDSLRARKKKEVAKDGQSEKGKAKTKEISLFYIFPFSL